MLIVDFIFQASGYSEYSYRPEISRYSEYSHLRQQSGGRAIAPDQPCAMGSKQCFNKVLKEVIPIWKDEVCWALVDVVWKDAKSWLWTRTTSLNYQRLIFSYLQKYFLFPKQIFPKYVLCKGGL